MSVYTCTHVRLCAYMHVQLYVLVCMHRFVRVLDWCLFDLCTAFHCMHTGPVDPLDQRPSLKDLDEKVVLLAAGKWFNFGLQLDIKPEALDAIKTPNGSNKEHCREMFRCWLAKEQGYGALPRTWSSVLHAVENSCGSEVSRELSELLHQRVNRVNSPSTCLPHSGTTSCE